MTTTKHPIKLEATSYHIWKDGSEYVGTIPEISKLITCRPDDFTVRGQSLEAASSALQGLIDKLILEKQILLPRQHLIDYLFEGCDGYGDSDDERPPLSIGVSLFVIYTIASHLAGVFRKNSQVTRTGLPKHYYSKGWDHGGFIESPIGKTEFLGKLGFFREGKASEAFQFMLLSAFILGKEEDMESNMLAVSSFHDWELAQVCKYNQDDLLRMEASILDKASTEDLFLYDCFRRGEEACERFIEERSF